jgi:hypothetical protein
MPGLCNGRLRRRKDGCDGSPGCGGTELRAAHWHSACCGGATGNMQCSNADVVKLERQVGCSVQRALRALDRFPACVRSPMDKAALGPGPGRAWVCESAS